VGGIDEFRKLLELLRRIGDVDSNNIKDLLLVVKKSRFIVFPCVVLEQVMLKSGL
jgi:hypothetical protein